MTEANSSPSDPSPAVPEAGSGLIRLSVVGTALFCLLGGLAAALPDTFTAAFVILSLLEFLAGMVAFVLAYLRAVDRSRTEAIGIGGLYFGAGAAPRRVQVLLMGSLTVQLVVSIIVAALRPYTPLAFGVLAPMWALGLAGMWVAAHGTFPARTPELTRAAQREADKERHRAASPPGRRRGTE